MEDWGRWVRAQLGTVVRLRPASNPDGEARVWRVEATGEAVHALAYLKLHRVADKWLRERAILERLVEAPVPRVLAAREDGWALLLSACPGQLASACTLALDERRALHEQAGRLRQELDAIPVDEPDALPLPVALARRLRAWTERGRARLPADLLREVESAFDSTVFEGALRRWSHRDLAPHNWIVATTPAGPRLSVIDFGQARPDVWLVDALKLWGGPWAEEPALAAAFWSGYGRRPSALELEQLHQLALLHGLATATWGELHGHAALRGHGQATLARALAVLRGAS